ncbi:lytic transglycosylase domain-containing protein [Acidovorax sp. NCPPB 4044]|uniref:lytic transglycosylase domain-containing protein n=1 Tax=Acidovorax sp. NCPPB 4044 TaxID=2940490 RepID=UPI0023047F9E|nr:lytic transglycosylase domain-containing protein [Acidovorax sp. NCPPB 4044]MDA8519858.1 lytic transglycosylase domain-containing protein [Acidovorax sp. NCPPB 4044]
MPPVLLGSLLLFLQQTAHADLWAYVDERGVTHFAAERIDERYALYFRGDVFDSATDGRSASSGTGIVPPGVAPAATAAGARRLAYFDIAPEVKRVKHHLRASATRHGLDYELLQAVIATESGFDPQAVSPRGAVGLMQVMPATAQRFGVAREAKRSVEQKLTDPGTNVAAGARYLRHLIDLFEGRLDLALAAYNAGEGAVQRAGHRIPAYRETQNYVKSVLGLYALLKPASAAQAPGPAAALPAGRGAAAGRVRMELAAPAAP